jgi:outer membrane lipoprotein-sorting protein
LTYVGKHERNGYNCHMVIYEAKELTFYEYTVQAKETATAVALKLNVHDYMLRAKNGLFNDFGFIKEGTKLKIPDFYCKKAILYIDEKTMLPVSVSIYDEYGLFESYDYTQMAINVPIDPSEFTKDFKDYGF